jgi:adenylate kinase family enzyme
MKMDEAASPPLGLHTDLYEIRMVEPYLRLGMNEPATFSLFSRPSSERPVLVAAGLEEALEVLDGFRYETPHLEYLRSQKVSEETLERLTDLQVTGELWAPPEGTVLLANAPLLESPGPLPVLRERIRQRQEGRTDDRHEGVTRHRFEDYHEKTAPLLRLLRPEVVHAVDARRSPVEVLHAVTGALEVEP